MTPTGSPPRLAPAEPQHLQRTLTDTEGAAALVRIYGWMHLARTLDDRLVTLFRQGVVRGTVAGGQGNEGLCVPLSLLLDKEIDVISFTHRDLAGHLIWGSSVTTLLCQYLANTGSPTAAREGNVHHGDPARRSLPMISHLGSMVPLVVGATDAQRRAGKQAVGVAQFGDGGSSTGDVHEAMNLASVLRVPVLFVIQNNAYAYSTPLHEQHAASCLAERAAGYGMPGRVVDATDVPGTLAVLRDEIEAVRAGGLPRLVEARTLRLRGHAAYDTCDYLPAGTAEAWFAQDPLPRLRSHLVEAGWADAVEAIELANRDHLEESLRAALAFPAPEAASLQGAVFATGSQTRRWKGPLTQSGSLTFAQALREAHRLLLAEAPETIVLGQDIADYGGPFKVTEGLLAEFGRKRVVNTPLSESATVGYAIGLARGGFRPIVEFQFADFSTDAFTQVTLNAGTFHFRSGAAVPLVLRLPCGGGLTFGSFHSQELEAAFLHLPGLKALYPSTPQDAFDALLAAWEDPNPVLLFEHKGLYRKARGEIVVDGGHTRVWMPRHVRSGDTATLVTYGEMTYVAEEAARFLEDEYGHTIDVWDLRALNPLRLEAIAASLQRTHRLAVLHEARLTLGLGAELVARLTGAHFYDLELPPLRITAQDMPVPFAPELETAYRPSRDRVVDALVNWLS